MVIARSPVVPLRRRPDRQAVPRPPTLAELRAARDVAALAYEASWGRIQAYEQLTRAATRRHQALAEALALADEALLRAMARP